ncbi:unnamed protein product [Rhodiola kirilowii]
MEHLPIHLADEVLLGGLVHYRWMYPFEHFIYRLKQLGKKRNRAEVEASIVNAYIQLKTSYLGLDYLDAELTTNFTSLKRKEVVAEDCEDPQISILNYPGVAGSILKRRVLDSNEFAKATHYIFRNTPEIEQYLALFESHLRQSHPRLNDRQVWELGETVSLPQWVHHLSSGFHSEITCSTTYKVNNYNFHIESHGEGRNTMNSHVYVKGTEGIHYYGVIDEIIHMRCRTHHTLRVLLFKCRWYDPQFVKSYPANGIVIVNTHRPYMHYDPYILAQQVVQVYYVTFPGLAGQNNQGWVAVCPVKQSNAIDMEVAIVPFQDDGQLGAEMPVINEVGSYGNLADDEVYEYTKEDVNEDNLTDDIADIQCDSDESS